MSKYIAGIVSYIFHPLFIVSYVLLLIMMINPYLFSIQDPRGKGIIIIFTIALTIFFPIVSILMMRGLALIKSIHMEDKYDRIGPLIATIVFYLWLFLNLKDNPGIPKAFSFFLLGTVITLFICFFLNIFQKVSLHAAGVGGLLVGIVLIGQNYGYEFIALNIGDSGFRIHLLALYMVIILICGLTMTSRLMVGAHSKDELYGGFFIGSVSQLIAYVIL